MLSSAGPSRTDVPNTRPANASLYPKTASRPHPYQYQLPTSLEENNFKTNRLPTVQISRDTNACNHGREKPPINAIGHPQPQPLPSRAPSRYHQPSLPLHLRPLVLFIFLPIPPLLSLLYMTVGHALLRIQKSSTSIYHASIHSSIEAGATGGAILSLPIALLLYLFISLNKQPSVPEDFFEDDDSVTTGSARCMMYSGYVACVVFLVGIGGVAGPLGVTCLSSATSNTEFVITRKMLTTGAAAAAGFVGGAILSVGMLLLGLLIAVVWLCCVRRNN